MYKVPYSFVGRLIKSVGEDYQVVKRERKYHGCGEEYMVKKREAISSTIYYYNIEAVGWEEYQVGKRTEIFGKKIKI